MTFNSKKTSSFSIASIIFSTAAIVFAVLSILNAQNLLLRICTQASLCAMMLTNGIRAIKYQNRKNIGYLHIGVFLLLLFALVLTIMTAVKKGAL